MCGICGFVYTGTNISESLLHNTLDNMVLSLHHRGPDSNGTWIDPLQRLFFGHTRLSILELSEQGHQPMISHSGRFVIVFNGEIYNYQQIKAELKALYHWHGTSDTEVLLQAIETWGIEKTLRICNGMFAFALYDTHSQTLYLARDRIGKKPLYYGNIHDNTFVFGSELKAIKQISWWKSSFNRKILDTYIGLSYIPAPYTIYDNIYKLIPGTFLTINLSDSGFVTKPYSPQYYWNPTQRFNECLHSLTKSTHDIEEAFELLLSDAVKLRMISDVTLGAFLSGGIDSSLIVALMQSQSPHSIKTFTLGFENTEYDESNYAREIADYLHTDHTHLLVTEKDALALVPFMAQVYDEPFADHSQIPTYLVSQLTKKHVTVALSGDGGDELFGGYTAYQTQAKVLALKKHFGGISVPSSCISKLDSLMFSDNSVVQTFISSFYTVYRYLKLLGTHSPASLLRTIESTTLIPLKKILLKPAGDCETKFDMFKESSNNDIESSMFIDFLSFLPDSVLVKVDRASMAHSLETRAPLLDYRIAEFAWSLPFHEKFNQKPKWLLRKLLKKHIPERLFERPKKGFCFPVAQWLRSELKDWMMDVLTSKKVITQGLFNPITIKCILKQHLSGRLNHDKLLWSILMFQSWCEYQDF